jgi:hypothetical protein
MSDNGHEPFDLEGEGDAIALFPESQEEKDARRDFYDTTPAKADEDFDVYTHSISISGSLGLKEKLNNCESVSITIADADGNVIAAGMGDISCGFVPHFTKEANIMERAHKAKLR